MTQDTVMKLNGPSVSDALFERRNRYFQALITPNISGPIMVKR